MKTFALILWISTNAPAAESPLTVLTLRTGLSEQACLEGAAQYEDRTPIYNDQAVRVSAFIGLMCKAEDRP